MIRITKKGELYIGAEFDDMYNFLGHATIPAKEFTMHQFIFAVSGAGKTEMLKFQYTCILIQKDIAEDLKRKGKLKENEVHSDSEIKTDNEALLDFTEMIIETQDAIIIVNSLKEKMFKLNEDLEKIKTENERLEAFKEKYQETLDNVKFSYEEKLEEQKREHEKELSKFISERLESATETYEEDDLPHDIVNFVKLQVEKIRELMAFEKKSVEDIKKSYSGLIETSLDPIMKEFSKLIIEVLDDKNIFQHSKFKKTELQIMKRIEEAIK